MQKKLCIRRFLVFLIVILSSISCSSELDFDQTDQLKLEPVLVGNLTYFEVKASDFVDNGSGQILVDVQNFTPFKDAFLRDNLRRIELYFEIENKIPRAFSINMVLLDNNKMPVYEIPILVPASNGTTIKVTATDFFEGQKLESVQQMMQVGFIVQMQPGTPLDANSIGALKLRSSATLYMEIK